MTRLIHLADVHLGASYSAFRGMADRRRVAVLEAFKGLVAIVEGAGAEAVLIAGDLFDGPAVDDATVAAAREGLRRIAQSGRPVFVIPGNHDSITLKRDVYRDLADGHDIIPVDSLDGVAHGRSDKVYLFRAPRFGAPISTQLPSGHLHVYGLAYDRAKHTDPLSTFVRGELPGVHVVLLHGPVPLATHWSQSGNALQLPPDALRHINADYIALGDFHSRWLPKDFSSAGDIHACYPGSFASLDLTETGQRGYAVVDIEPEGNPSITFRSTCLPCAHQLGDFDIGNFENEAAVASAIGKLVPDQGLPVVRLVGSPRFPLDVARVVNALEQQFQCARVVDATTYFAASRLTSIASEDTVAGHLVRLARERIEATTNEETRITLDGSLRAALRAMGAA